MSETQGKCARTEPVDEESCAIDKESRICKVVSVEGNVLCLPHEVALRTDTLKDWIEDTGGEGEYQTPLCAEGLQMLRAVCAHEGDEATSPLASLPLDKTADLLCAANFLAATTVFAAAARHLCGTLLAGKSVDELRSALCAANDLSVDEQKAAPLEPFHTPPASLGAAEEETSAAETLLSGPPVIRRSLSTRTGNEDVIVSALEAADTLLLCRLKAVSQAWGARARNQLCARVSCCCAGHPAPAIDMISELDVELLSAAGRMHEAVVAGRQLPSLAWLHGWGFVVDVQAVRRADLSEIKEEEDEEEDDEEEDGDEQQILTKVLRALTQGEGEPPLELLLAAVACAAPGKVLGVPVQQMREGNLAELSLDACGTGGIRLLGLLLPVCGLVYLW